MKSIVHVKKWQSARVAPLVGVWIEIMGCWVTAYARAVAPLVGVWIEISSHKEQKRNLLASLPSWECGLKCLKVQCYLKALFVAPLVGVWIEIFFVKPDGEVIP